MAPDRVPPASRPAAGPRARRTTGVCTVGASWGAGPVSPGAAGADIALLSGVTRIHPVFAVEEPVAPDAVRWTGGRVSAGRGPGRVPAACGVSRFVMVVPPR
ncbi:hypothetical protein [Streptomyces sp. NPDC058751]|uniref:hypothetical protein n=1 Tax=Streptomyces sp. NPDC058751 TaxID=3346623 RepID=UPI0036BD4E11